MGTLQDIELERQKKLFEENMKKMKADVEKARAEEKEKGINFLGLN